VPVSAATPGTSVAVPQAPFTSATTNTCECDPESVKLPAASQLAGEPHDTESIWEVAAEPGMATWTALPHRPPFSSATKAWSCLAASS
jgi:hypothetical protein